MSLSAGLIGMRKKSYTQLRGAMPACRAMQGGRARPVRLVDIPGHPRVRGKLEAYLGRGASGVVFVVDSVDFMPKKTEAAE
jgi:hypothetical protein